MPSYTVYCSRVDAKTFKWACMSPLSHLSFVFKQVKFRPEKKVEIKVSRSVVAVGTVVAGAARYLRFIEWKVEPVLLLSLSYAFLI